MQQQRRSFGRNARTAFTWLAVGLVGCTYDFDPFARSDGAIATGGTTAAEGGVGNVGGTKVGGHSSALGGGSATTLASSKACAGVPNSGLCWYLGAAGESCDQVCSPHGKAAAEAASFVGTEAQGGSAQKCAVLLTLLGVAATVQSGERTDGRGLGCHLYDATPWWLRAPTYSISASQVLSRRVCGCNS